MAKATETPSTPAETVGIAKAAPKVERKGDLVTTTKANGLVIVNAAGKDRQ